MWCHRIWKKKVFERGNGQVKWEIKKDDLTDSGFWGIAEIQIDGVEE